MNQSRQQSRGHATSRRGLAAVELLLAIGLYFIAAWAFIRLGAQGYVAWLQLVESMVLWPLG